MNTARNSKRWATDQMKRARAAFASTLPTVEEKRAADLAGLRDCEALMRDAPHMASTLEEVRAEIRRLEAAS